MASMVIEAVFGSEPKRPRLTVVAVSTASTCGCGQELDICHAGHCPRCGITLRA